MLSAGFKDSNRKVTSKEQSVSKVNDGLSQLEPHKGKSVRRAGNSKAFELDRGFITSFLNGEMCLRGVCSCAKSTILEVWCLTFSSSYINQSMPQLENSL